MKKFFRIFAMALTGAVAIGVVSCNNGGGDEPVFRVSTTQLIFSPEGETKSVTVTGADWSASTTDAWIELSATDGVAGESFDVTLSATDVAMNGSITVTDADSGRQITISVAQSAPGVVIELSTEALTFDASGNADNATVTVTGGQWNATTSDSWITLSANSGLDGDSFSVSVAAYNGEQARVGSVIVGNSKTVTVTQEPPYGLTLTYVKGMKQYAESGNSATVTNIVLSDFAEDGYPNSGNGYSLFLELIVEKATGGMVDITPGTYIISENWQNPQVFDAPWGNNYIAKYVDGQLTMPVKESGTIVVSGDHNKYTIKADIVLEGGEIFKASYTGPILIFNPAIPSTLTEDYDFGTLTQAEGVGEFWGEIAGMLYNDYCQLYVDIISDPSDGLEEGLYSIDDSFSFMPGTVLAGGDSGYGLEYTRIVITDGNGNFAGQAPLASGTFDVSKSGSVYTIEVDAEDGFGHRITGTFTGELPL